MVPFVATETNPGVWIVPCAVVMSPVRARLPAFDDLWFTWKKDIRVCMIFDVTLLCFELVEKCSYDCSRNCIIRDIPGVVSVNSDCHCEEE